MVGQVYEGILRLIVTGRMRSGERLVETQLAALFNVSRTPIREALARLEREGHLTDRTGGRRRGLVVTPLPTAAVAQLWELIGSIEGAAAAEAARVSASTRRALALELLEANDELAAAYARVPRSTDQLFRGQAHFHEVLVNRGGHPPLRAAHEVVRPHVRRIEWLLSTIESGDGQESLSEHRGIIEAIERGDPQLARSAVESHWGRAAVRTRRSLGDNHDGTIDESDQ
jgi:DNA-binding GntR family transcriptional regulator